MAKTQTRLARSNIPNEAVEIRADRGLGLDLGPQDCNLTAWLFATSARPLASTRGAPG